ncbi:asparagine synthase (glutamine-hydrolyzing) [soil metagenome]
MCGITGIVNFNNSGIVNYEKIARMCKAIEHRGPDDEGIYIDEAANVGFGHRRLSIIDLKTGHQPMWDSEKKFAIIFNGEIYNFKELRSELRLKGYNFNTTSDTEVIINLYKDKGIESFEKLNGIFSLAIYDKVEKTVTLARDHFGVKPMYYYFDNNNLVFGSEIKTIIQSGLYKTEMDFEALNSYFTFRYNPSPQTLFKNIKKLPPAGYLKINKDGKIELNSYWNYYPSTNININEFDAIEQYQSLLEASVKRQMISDVPVGLLLSGGVDSAVIGKLMTSYSNEKIKSFTVGFEGQGDYNELKDASVSAAFLGTEHYEMTITKNEYIDFLFRCYFYVEEPIAETTIPALYYIDNLASKNLKVVLAGQGADEPMAGYKRYFGEQKLNKYLPFFKMLPMTHLMKFIPRNDRLKRAVYASGFGNEIERFLAIYTIFTPEQKKYLFKKDVLEKMNFGSSTDLEMVNKLYKKTESLIGSLSKILFIDTRMSLSDDLLIFNDKMSMANSLEMRVPFLDVELVKFLETLPSDLKLRSGIHKYIHKQALKKWLPKEIIYRKKRGFETPMDQWMQNELADEIRDIFNDKDSAMNEFFNISYINSLIDNHKRRKENNKKNLFILLSFELWYQSFFKKYKFVN